MSVLTSEARPVRTVSAAVSWLASPYFFWFVLALYLVAHVALRLWETPNITKNDVQEALSAQGWAWGYHPRNPPLHTWLLMGSYSIFGVGLFAHVILKYVLLGAAYAFAYLSGRRLLSTKACAVVSALSLTLLTPLAWTVHTAFTHTLLLAVMIFATLWAAIRLAARQRRLDYALFGVVVGLGFLAKYSYPLFLSPFLAAMLCQSEFRRVILSAKILISLALAILVFAPHALWMATAQFDFVEFLAEKQRSAAPHPYVIDALSGFGNVAVGALSFLGVFLLLSPILLVGEKGARAPAARPWPRTLLLTLCFALGLLLLDVIVLRATQFEERYFMCALLLAPLALFAWLDQGAVSEKRLGAFAMAILAVTSIVLIGLGGRAFLYNRSCDRCLDEMPVADLARHIRVESDFRGGTIASDHYDVAGNMRVAFPDSRVIAANYPVEHPLRDSAGQCLLVWHARRAGDSLPPLLEAYTARQHLTLSPGGPRYVDAPLRRSFTRRDRFAYWVLSGADGNCNPR